MIRNKKKIDKLDSTRLDEISNGVSQGKSSNPKRKKQKMSMTDIINRSPKLLAEIKKAREGLKHETLVDYKDIFGSDVKSARKGSTYA